MRGGDTGQMSGSTGGGDDDFHAARFGFGHKLGGLFGSAVRRKHAGFMCDPKLCEHGVGMLHGVPIGFAPHDDDD